MTAYAYTHYFIVYPGTVTLDDGSTRTMDENAVALAYGLDGDPSNVGGSNWVSSEIFPEGTTGLESMNYIHLKPRSDNVYQNWRDYAMDTGLPVNYGPDFDGTKRFTDETNPNNIYSDEIDEEKLYDNGKIIID